MLYCLASALGAFLHTQLCFTCQLDPGDLQQLGSLITAAKRFLYVSRCCLNEAHGLRTFEDPSSRVKCVMKQLQPQLHHDQSLECFLNEWQPMVPSVHVSRFAPKHNQPCLTKSCNVLLQMCVHQTALSVHPLVCVLEDLQGHTAMWAVSILHANTCIFLNSSVHLTLRVRSGF